ncbi:hypothetical protein [Streptomyces sp. NPDC059816]|uniref:hypothetical protein n=1 Tax=Streptomyces sp. NPDC059816 TaxID=3346960 RepID=UPI003656C96A
MTTTIECPATRRGRYWVARVPGHHVYGQGRTLKAVGENTAKGLALVGVTAEVTIVPTTPELAALREAENTRRAAEIEAMVTLDLRRATLGDIARATGVPRSRVKQILADQARTASPLPLPKTS